MKNFYYLFLGRAFLEKSATTPDVLETERLLATAEVRLLEAQEINPLNTDHTANLARLHSRWAQTNPASQDFEFHIEQAEGYYLSALDLSPNNSVIWNEYAQLYLGLRGDCEGAIEIFEGSLTVDPYYGETYVRAADTYATCAEQLDEADLQRAYYQSAIENYRLGLNPPLSRRPNENPAILLQIGQLHRLLEQWDEAMAAFDEALPLANNAVPDWNIQFQRAQVLADPW